MPKTLRSQKPGSTVPVRDGLEIELDIRKLPNMERDRSNRMWDLTWDVLLEQTGALGLHFEDHEEMQDYWLPEWSHMTGVEAGRFTEAFYGLVQRELGAREAVGGNP